MRRTEQVWSKRALGGKIFVECIYPRLSVHEMNESTVGKGELAKDMFAKDKNELRTTEKVHGM